MESVEHTEVSSNQMEPKIPLPISSHLPHSFVDRAHLDSMQNFVDDFNIAMTGVLARSGSPYEKVSVLFLRWEDDVFLKPGVNNGVQGEIDRLERVFTNDYGFDTETYLIPSENSQRSLQKKIFRFQDDHDRRSELLLVYYGGHGVLNNLNQSIWAQGDGPSVDWYSIQHLLENAVPDVAIFLDCCYAASADRRSVDGTIEVLAACCRETTTIEISDWSFTSRLTEVLQDSRERPLTVAMLHAKLANYRGAEGSKKLLKTPVHSIMSGKDKASIRLYPITPGSTLPPALSDSDLSQQSSLSSSTGLFENNSPSSTRVLVVVSLKDRVQDVGDWLEWLTTHMPTDVTNLRLIQPEGLWEAHSTLGLISMPVAVWDLFPQNTAYYCVGYIKTPNLLFQDLELVPTKNVIDKILESKAVKEYQTEYLPRDNSQYPIIRRDDLLIAVIGITGADKSDFIAKATGKAVEVVSGLDSRFKVVQCYSFLHRGETVHLIDIPEFDGTLVSEVDMFRRTFDWLRKGYGSSVRLNGVISVHPISTINPYVPVYDMWQSMRDPRTELHQMFTLLTTKWDVVRSDVAEKREAELKRTTMWVPEWRIFGFDGTRESAAWALEAITPYLQPNNERTPLVEDLYPMKQQYGDFEIDPSNKTRQVISLLHGLNKIDKRLNDVQPSDRAIRVHGLREKAVVALAQLQQLLTAIESSEAEPSSEHVQDPEPLRPGRAAFRLDEEIRRGVVAAVGVLCTIM